MQGRQDKGSAGGKRDFRRPQLLEIPQQDVVGNIPREHHGTADVLGGEVLDRMSRWGAEQVAHPIHFPPDELLGRGRPFHPKSRLDMDEGDAEFTGRAGGAGRAVGVANDDRGVGTPERQGLSGAPADRLDHVARRHVASPQHVVGCPHVQLSVEIRVQRQIVVLAGLDGDDIKKPPKRLDEQRDLDDLRAGAVAEREEGWGHGDGERGTGNGERENRVP